MRPSSVLHALTVRNMHRRVTVRRENRENRQAALSIGGRRKRRDTIPDYEKRSVAALLAPLGWSRLDRAGQLRAGWGDSLSHQLRAGAKDGAIAIWASSRADRIDTKTPLLKTRTSPVEVTVAGPGRVYFHLKAASGPRGCRVAPHSARRLSQFP